MKIDKIDYSKYMYTTSHIGNSIEISSIEKETNTTFILKGGKKVRKKDGYVIGSDSGGRFGSFSQIYYAPLTKEIYGEYLKQLLNIKITNFSNRYIIDITDENYDEVKSIHERLTQIFKKKEQK
jgi:hypothetical protein